MTITRVPISKLDLEGCEECKSIYNEMCSVYGNNMKVTDSEYVLTLTRKVKVSKKLFNFYLNGHKCIKRK